MLTETLEAAVRHHVRVHDGDERRKESQVAPRVGAVIDCLAEKAAEQPEKQGDDARERQCLAQQSRDAARDVLLFSRDLRSREREGKVFPRPVLRSRWRQL